MQAGSSLSIIHYKYFHKICKQINLQVAKNRKRNMTEKDLMNAKLVHTVQSHANNENKALRDDQAGRKSTCRREMGNNWSGLIMYLSM